MPIAHKFIEDLLLLENTQTFCGQSLIGNYNFLIIGTFNPNDDGVTAGNAATWFYGRSRNKFWKYVPEAINGISLHPSLQIDNPESWKQFCITNRIVIIDIVKTIHHVQPLIDFKDKEVNDRINPNLNNVDVFNIRQAFRNITFNKVLYTLGWTDNTIHQLILIRNLINDALVETECVKNLQDILYVNSPARNDSGPAWHQAINA